MASLLCLLRLAVFIICAFVFFTNATIPSYIHVCKRTDPNIAPCIKNAISSLRDNLAQGIPELNVPPMEPLIIPRLQLKNVDFNITDLAIHGPSNYELIDLGVDIEKNRFTFIYKFKELTYDGKYSMNLKVLRLPLKTNGPMHGTFKNYQISGKMQGKKIKENNKTHLIFRPLQIKIHPGESKMKLENLFDGQRELQSAANELLSENNELFTKEILPALEVTLGEHFTMIANRITSQFSYDELFPLN